MANGLKQERINLTLEQLVTARQATEKVATVLEQKLFLYVEALRPILLPAFSGRSASIALGGEKSVSELKDRYRAVAEKRLNLPRDFEAGWLDEVGTKVELRRWEYTHDLQAGAQKYTVQITSPTRWLAYYGLGLNPVQAALAFSNREEKNLTPLRQFLVNALVFALVIQRNAGLTALLSALHFHVELVEYPALQNLPMVVINAEIPSLLPPDDLIRTATAFSGVPAFIELLDLASVDAIRDPFKDAIEQALRS